MKISKLFHWLYAFLMFLPITFILPTLFYFGFNDNATAQEYTKEEPIYYQTNEVVSYEDLEFEHAYLWLGNYSGGGSTSLFVCQIKIDDSIKSLFNAWDDSATNVRMWYNGTGTIQLNVYRETTYLNAVNVNGVSFPFVCLTNYLNGNVLALDYISSYASYVKEYQDVTYTMGITESVNQSILDTFDLPMFSWTSDNFIIAPFNYITDLFGLPQGNVINKYLDYWLTISIVYLCFDVIMYVPLLVHRWLDKGIVE